MYKFQLTKAFIILATVSTSAKLMLPLLGGNADMISWQIVGDIVSQGQTIYDNTARYNYGPIWGYFLGLVGLVVKLVWGSNVYVSGFHFIVTAFLSIVDISIAVMLWKLFGKIPSYLFLINPISIIISGSHGQFDNFAILLALVSWYLILQKKFAGYLVLGLSLATKHLFLFFPFWLLISEIVKKDYKQTKKTIFGVFTAYSIFAIGFLLEIFRNIQSVSSIVSGIAKNVFGYRGYDIGLGKLLTDFMVPQKIFEFSNHLPIISGYMFFYVLGIILVGMVVIKFGIERKYYPVLYLLTFFGLAISEARQYAAIPLIGLVVFYRKIPSLIAMVIGTVYVMTTSYRSMVITDPVELFIYIGGKLIPSIPYVYGWVTTQVNFQTWSLVLLVSVVIIGYQKKHHNFLSVKMLLSLFVVNFLSVLIIINTLYFHMTKTIPADIETINVSDSVTIICKRPLIGYAYRIQKEEKVDKYLQCNFEFPIF